MSPNTSDHLICHQVCHCICHQMQFITTFVTLFVTKFITKFGDSLNSSPNLVTNLVTNSSQKTLGLLVQRYKSRIRQIFFYKIPVEKLKLNLVESWITFDKRSPPDPQQNVIFEHTLQIKTIWVLCFLSCFAPLKNSFLVPLSTQKKPRLYWKNNLISCNKLLINLMATFADLVNFEQNK